MHSPDFERMPLLHAGRRVAADSCSLILLNRLRLLESYNRMHAIVLTQALYEEITAAPGAETPAEERAVYTRLLAGRVQTLPPGNRCCALPAAGLSAADRTLIRAFYTLNLDGILTDDKKVCRCCCRLAIPYINTPMALFALLCTGGLSHTVYTCALQELYAMGRYAPFVRAHMEDLYRSYRAYVQPGQKR